MKVASQLAILGSFAFGLTGVFAQSSATDAIPVSTYCGGASGLCVSVNVPDESSTDLFVQIKGATGGGWTGVGIGSQMAGALIFLVYPSSDGKNVTISPRLGRGHIPPEYTDEVKYELLAGSGVASNVLTANFKCTNCRSWSGGSLDSSSTKESFIWAVGGGNNFLSSDPEEQIQHHSNKGTFSLNLVSATGGDGTVDPFSGRPAPTTTEGSEETDAPVSKATKLIIAHGVIMSLTWVILFPLGAAIIRLFNDRFSNAMSIHRALQIGNFLLVVVALGLGIAASGENGTHFTSSHQFLGVVLVGLLLVQGALGALHHSQYVKTGKRSIWSYGHIWLGRSVIILAIINGGIGLGLAEASAGLKAAYAIVVVVVAGAYAGFYFLKSRRRHSSSGSDGSTRLP